MRCVSGKTLGFPCLCYRLALGRASSRKTLLYCMIWQFPMPFSVKWGLETTRLKVPLTVGLVFDVSITRLSISRVCLWNVDTMRGLSNEVVEVMCRSNVDICGLQEVRWRGASARLVKGKDFRYKMFWVENEKDMGGVRILLVEKWM